MWMWVRSWFVRPVKPVKAPWFDPFLCRVTAILPHSENPQLDKLREQNRQLIAENERRSAEVSWMRSMLDRLVSPQCDESFIKLLNAHSPINPETATCTPSHPADSRFHPPNSEAPCHRQSEHVSPSDSQSVPAQMPTGFRLES